MDVTGCAKAAGGRLKKLLNGPAWMTQTDKRLWPI
jgi:hypothetical protein